MWNEYNNTNSLELDTKFFKSLLINQLLESQWFAFDFLFLAPVNQLTPFSTSVVVYNLFIRLQTSWEKLESWVSLDFVSLSQLGVGGGINISKLDFSL